MTTTDCYVCHREAEFSQLPPRELIAFDEHWRVAHAFGTGLLGWLVLTPRRHVTELAELTDEESADLGRWQVRLAQALAQELGTPKTYVAQFGEAAGFHLHFHVVSRPQDLEASMRGPGVFAFLGHTAEDQVNAGDRDDFARRMTAHLSA